MAEQHATNSKKSRRLESEKLILAAAEKVFAEAGYGGATMQLIADLAGLPKANLHYYFPTKELLYRQVVEKIFNIWLKAADAFDERSVVDVESMLVFVSSAAALRPFGETDAALAFFNWANF